MRKLRHFRNKKLQDAGKNQQLVGVQMAWNFLLESNYDILRQQVSDLIIVGYQDSGQGF